MKKWIIISTLLINLSLFLFNAPVFASVVNSNIQSFEATSLIKADGSYWVWGKDQTVPLQIHGLSEVEKSFDHQLIMKKDKSVWLWDKLAPFGAVDKYHIKALNNLIEVYSASNDILALDKEGKVYLLSTQGSLDPSQLNQLSPLSGIDNVVDITSYFEYSEQGAELRWVFLKKDGSVWVNKGNFPLLAFEPIEALTSVIDIEQSNALKQDGTLWYWPIEAVNGSGKSIRAEPIKELTKIRKVKAFRNSFIAIDQNNSLWFWGVTVTGYSDGTTYHYNPVPVKVTSVDDVKDAFVVERSLVVLTNRGDVYISSIERETMPENPVFDHLASEAQQIKAGSRHIILQKNDGSLWGWGVNKNGQLGCGDYEFMYNTPQRMQKPTSVYLNGESVVLNSGVINRNGQSFIPLRSIFEKMGAGVQWDPSSKSVTITKSETEQPVNITIKYGLGEVYLDQKQVLLPNRPFILGSTAYLPLRFISEALGARVEWLQNQDKITISTNTLP